MLARVVAVTLSLFVAADLGKATSIVVDVTSDGIIVLADSRAEDSSSTAPRDDQCKIAILGPNLIFAETGNEGYKPSVSTDWVPEWHGTAEAVKAYILVKSHSLDDVALQWSLQLTENFKIFYRADPKRVRELARLSWGNLVVGIFAGKDSSGKMRALVARVALDDTLIERENVLIPIGHAISEIPVDRQPYSTNGVTQELLDGKTDRALAVAELWVKSSRHVPKRDRQLRRLEFMIEQTANYDEGVHPPVNAALVTTTSSIWLQNKTCQSPHSPC